MAKIVKGFILFTGFVVYLTAIVSHPETLAIPLLVMPMIALVVMAAIYLAFKCRNLQHENEDLKDEISSLNDELVCIQQENLELYNALHEREARGVKNRREVMQHLLQSPRDDT